MTTQTYTAKLVVQACVRCGMTFGVAQDYDRRRREDQRTFYCPAGHPQSYCGETDLQKAERFRANAERRMQQAEIRATAYRDQADAAERSARAYKGHATRVRRRAQQGVCPCCTRQFQDLRRHMAGQHPDFMPDQP